MKISVKGQRHLVRPEGGRCCGMADAEAPTYHPYAACLMFFACANGDTVADNLRAVVAYGMKAQKAGVTLDEAMSDIRWMAAPTEGEGGEDG